MANTNQAISSSRSASANQKVLTTIFVSGFIMAALFILLYFLEGTMDNLLGGFAEKVTIGLMLLVMWLTVGSAVRTINRHNRGTSFFVLLAAGVLTAALGSAVFTAFLFVFKKISKAKDVFEIAGANGGMILVMSALGFVAALLAIINARVEGKMLGNLLELLIIGTCIGGFLYFATK